MSGVEDTVVESPKKTGRVKYFVSVGVLALVAVIACVYLFVVAPHNRAVKAFEVAAAQVQEKNSALQAEIDAAQQSLDKGDKPLDVATQDALTVAVADAGLVLRAIPEMPSSTSDIEAATEALNEPLDYSATSKTLADASQAFDKSVRQLGQVMAPSQDLGGAGRARRTVVDHQIRFPQMALHACGAPAGCFGLCGLPRKEGLLRRRGAFCHNTGH